MRKLLRRFAVASLLVAWAGLPVAALAHGDRAKQHRYIYYPGHEVYYAPATQLWFWLDGGRWRAGASMPDGIVVAGVPGVSVFLGTERPYEMNTYVVQRFGGRHRDREHRRGRHRHRHDDD